MNLGRGMERREEEWKRVERKKETKRINEKTLREKKRTEEKKKAGQNEKHFDELWDAVRVPSRPCSRVYAKLGILQITQI